MYSLRKQDTMKGQSVQWPIIIAYEIFNIRDGCYVDTMYSSRIVFCGVASKRVVLGFRQLSTFSRIPFDSVIIESKQFETVMIMQAISMQKIESLYFFV